MFIQSQIYKRRKNKTKIIIQTRILYFINFNVSFSLRLISEDQSIFTSILNATLPVLTYIIVGYIIYKLKIFDSQTTMLNITFNFTFPISLIYSIGTIDLEVKDLKIIVVFWLTSFIMIPFIILQVKLFDKEKQLLALAHINICVNILNILITGLPLTQGFYDQKLSEKYSYILTFGQFVINYPLSFFLFAYSNQYYKSTSGKLSKSDICKLIKQSLLATIKNPMVDGIIIALIYNLLRSTCISWLNQLPFYLENVFKSLSVITRTFGVPPIGIFMGMQIDQIKQNNKQKKAVSMQQDQTETGENQDKLDSDKDLKKEQQWPLSKNILYFICTAVIRHLLFPIVGVILLILFKTDKESIQVLSSLFTCNSGLQAFQLSDQYNIHQVNAGFIILIGIILTILCTLLFKVILNAIDI